MMDVVLNISALMVIGASVIPMTIHIMVKSSQVKEDHLATTYLYEKLHELIIAKQQPRFQTFEKNGVLFEIIPVLSQKEVCIQFEDYTKSKKRICAHWE